MRKSELYNSTLKELEANCPQISTELNWETSFQLLVAVVLSAQCTDERINIVTPALFAKYPDAKAMSQANVEEIFKLIRSVTYPNSKAKYLVTLSQQIVRDFNCEIPSEVEHLTQLAGVGRKTANVIQAIAFNKAAIAVDTHVYRVSHRIGLVSTREKTPLAVEQKLCKNIDKEKWKEAHFWLLYHGRYTCTARKPKCQNCCINNICITNQRGNKNN